MTSLNLLVLNLVRRLITVTLQTLIDEKTDPNRPHRHTDDQFCECKSRGKGADAQSLIFATYVARRLATNARNALATRVREARGRVQYRVNDGNDRNKRFLGA